MLSYTERMKRAGANINKKRTRNHYAQLEYLESDPNDFSNDFEAGIAPRNFITSPSSASESSALNKRNGRSLCGGFQRVLVRPNAVGSLVCLLAVRSMAECIGALLLLASFVGGITNGVFIVVPGPTFITSMAVPTWLCLLLFFLGAELFLAARMNLGIWDPFTRTVHWLISILALLLVITFAALCRLPNEGVWASLMLLASSLVLVVAPATQSKKTLQAALSIGADGMRSSSPTIAKDLSSGWRVALMRDFSSSSSSGGRADDASFSYESETDETWGGVTMDNNDPTGENGPFCYCCARLSCWCLSRTFCLVMALVVTGFLSAGAVILADGAVKYTYNPGNGGKFVTVKLPTLGSNPQRIFYRCLGSNDAQGQDQDQDQDSSRHTIILVADAAPGSGSAVGSPCQDLLPLQEALVDKGWRVCTFDPPGLGLSDPWYSSQYMDSATYMDELLEAIAGDGPVTYICVYIYMCMYVYVVCVCV